MSVVSRPTTTAPARIRQIGRACAWIAAGGMLLYVLMRFGPALVDTFAHGDTGWLRLLIIVVALAGADVGGLMLVLHGPATPQYGIGIQWPGQDYGGE
jgi:hypothetical protein